MSAPDGWESIPEGMDGGSDLCAELVDLEQPCLTSVYLEVDGWHYDCRCGFRSCPMWREELARKFAGMHEAAA